MTLSLCFSCDDTNYKNAINESIKVAKTLPDIESIIVIQNLSKTLDVSSKYIDSLSKLKIRVYIQEGKGLSRSRNLAISKCRSEYIWILDGDIQFEIEEMKLLYCHLLSNKDDSISYSIKIKCLELDHYFKNYKYIELLGSLNFLKISSCEVIFKRSACNLSMPFNERLGLGAEFLGGEENDFLLKINKSNIATHKFLNFTPLKHTCLEENRSKANIKVLYAKGYVLRNTKNFLSFFVLIYWMIKFSFFKWKDFKSISYLVYGYFKGLPNG